MILSFYCLCKEHNVKIPLTSYKDIRLSILEKLPDVKKHRTFITGVCIPKPTQRICHLTPMAQKYVQYYIFTSKHITKS